MTTPQADAYDKSLSRSNSQDIKDAWEEVEIAILQLLENPAIPVFAKPMINQFLDELLKDFREKIKSI